MTERVELIGLDEIWKPVVGLETKYEVSNLGRIKCVSRTSNYKPGHIKALFSYATGYVKTCLSVSGKRKSFHVHRLVAKAFLGPPPPGYQCAHLDGNPRNNRLENLRWVTRSENERHKIAHKTQLCGMRNHNCKTSFLEVVAIRELCASGKISQKTIAACFGVSRQNVSDLYLRKCRLNS